MSVTSSALTSVFLQPSPADAAGAPTGAREDAARAAAAVDRLTARLDALEGRGGLAAPAAPVGARVSLEASDAEARREALEALQGAPGVRLLGLMAMGPLDSRPGARTTDEVFRDVQALASDLDPALFHGGRCLLSMGMSGDLEAAVRHGSTSLRVGSALFEGLDDACFRGGGA